MSDEGALYEDEQLMRAMDGILEQHEVSIAEAKDLRKLKEYDIIIIADDSGSMRLKDEGMKETRWEELRSTLKLVVSLGSCFDEDGLDIYFLNRDKVEGVKSADDDNLRKSFLDLPRGSTPLSKVLNQVVKDREAQVREKPALKEKPVLLMIFTDGRPDDTPEVFGSNLSKVLKKQSTKLEFRCQLFACTGKDADIQWARDLDDQLDELDFTDDFLTVKKEMDKIGAYTSFTMGDWCLKAMLGAIDPLFDDPGKVLKAGGTSNKDLEKKKTNPFLQLFLTILILFGMFYVYSEVSRMKEEL